MPTPRTPTAKAKLTGAYKNHPERFKDREDPTAGRPLGDPPEVLTDAERAIWLRCFLVWPWLTEADRAVLHVFCRVAALVEDPDKFPKLAHLTLHRSLLSDLGGTPVSRSKVTEQKPKEPKKDNPFDKFGPGGVA